MKRLHPFYLLALLLIQLSCSTNEEPSKIRVNSEFAQYIQAYTSGVISRSSSIRIQLAQDYQGDFENQQTKAVNLFTLIPAVKGKTRWINCNTMIFEPDHILPSGTDYEVRFDLAAV